MSNPTANAGTDQTVNDDVPLVLTGVAQQGTYVINNTLWTKTSGPDCTMTNPAMAVNEVFEISAGTYVFTFTAYDLLGNSGSDSVTVTVSHTTGPIYVNDIYGTPTNFSVGIDNSHVNDV